MARDARFDGVFFVGVTTTGIYCRPICTARVAGRDRCVFFAHAAEAEREGFRACFRCRPELSPGNAPVDAVPRLAATAIRRIEQGVLNDGSVEDLARELGVTDRHLRRAVVDAVGVSPVELAQSARLAFAKRLLQDSGLKLGDIAFASGFQSVRRFNSAFRERFERSPTAVRRQLGTPDNPSVRLRLDYRPPLAWESLLAFFSHREIPGVELVEQGVYRRSISLLGKRGWVEIATHASKPALIASVSASLLGVLMPLVNRLRAAFDLDAHPRQIDAHLRRHPVLQRLVRKAPGLRVPGTLDGFETAVRAVLGQRISVRGAVTLAGRLVDRFGAPLANGPSGLTHLFPTSRSLAEATVDSVASLGIPAARAAALIGLARSVEGGLALHAGAPFESTVAKLLALPGLGDRTAQVIAMRALSWPDAFPASDLGVMRALEVANAAESMKQAEAWRPWRSYAVLHLWNGGMA
jgi:AraC family transcriptional regulator, regulatory protein of adaptative response / DNA-3-methyladenine glycosylase II